MPYNDGAVGIFAKGFLYTAPALTVSPTVAAIEAYLANGAIAGWDNAGHTDRDELPEFGFDGGDTEVLGTWQNAALRSVTSETPVDFVVIRLIQFDSNVLSMYYGQANTSGEAGRFRVAGAPVSSLERAMLIVMVDGNTNVAFYAPKVSMKRDASIELAVDQFPFLPVRATLLQGTVGGNDILFDWISADTAIVGS